MKGDVELAEVELGAGALGDEPLQPLGERDAAGVDADEGDRLEVVVALDDLVRDPRERPLDRFARPAGGARPGRRQAYSFELLSGLAGPI